MTIRELATIFQGVIKEYVDCADFDEKVEPQSELLRSLIKALRDRDTLTDEQIDYSCSPVLYHNIKWDDDAFIKACDSDQLDFAKWLHKDTVHNYDHMFRMRCLRGNFKLVKWLKDNWPYINHRHNDDSPFVEACAYGHLELAKWLKSNWPDIDHRAQNDKAFRLACIHGYLEVAQWLKQQWPDINHRADNDDVFRHAYFWPDLPVYKWLRETWPDIKYVSPI